jgi:hypothetical protein
VRQNDDAVSASFHAFSCNTVKSSLRKPGSDAAAADEDQAEQPQHGGNESVGLKYIDDDASSVGGDSSSHWIGDKEGAPLSVRRKPTLKSTDRVSVFVPVEEETVDNFVASAEGPREAP